LLRLSPIPQFGGCRRATTISLIRTLTTEHAESDRMSAFLAKEDWATWLGENDASVEFAKACLFFDLS
jgi:hypothetical protein